MKITSEPWTHDPVKIANCQVSYVLAIGLGVVTP